MPEPLATGATDIYDCFILASVKTYGHPDAMLIKAQIAQESGFNPNAISPDSPCKIPMGWTDAESKSFGLMQVTPACNEGSSLLMADGHPNLTTAMDAGALWETSAFNPAHNIDAGVKTTVDFLNAVKTRFPGCTNAQYNLMSAGAFNSGAGSILGCGLYDTRAAAYVTAVLGAYSEFASNAGWPSQY